MHDTVTCILIAETVLSLQRAVKKSLINELKSYQYIYVVHLC